MYQSCRYNRLVDLQEVDQFGFVNLETSIENGFVPNNLSSDVGNYDGTSESLDPESFVGTPTDVFEAYRMQESLAIGVKSSIDSSADNAKNE